MAHILSKGNPCPYMNEICHNTLGSFYCDCEAGYQDPGFDRQAVFKV